MRALTQTQSQPQPQSASFNLAQSSTTRTGLRSPEEGKTRPTGKALSPVAHDFSRIPAYPSTGGVIQPKLAINTPGDKYEQEADRVAEQVMRMPDSSVNSSSSVYSQAPDLAVQRKCDACEKEEEVKDEEVLQRSHTPDARAVGESSSPVPSIVGNVLQSPGKPLDGTTRAFMEPRFSADFSNVRIHSDGAAATSAQAIHAHAYTVGEQIVFNRGHYAPGTDKGRHLLAHELTHVMQQRKSSIANRVQRQTPDSPGGEKKPETIGSEKAMSVCEEPCGKFPWFEVAPDRFLSLCDDTVSLSDPVVTTSGCPPGGSGNVIFVSGRPAWSLTNQCTNCTAPASEKKPMPKVEVGYIQTAEKVLSGGVYYKQNAAGKWEWSDNEWLCVSNARDGHPTSTAPWFGPDAAGNFGPQQYPNCPSLMDNPFVKLPSHKNGGSLRRMRIDGVFHIWLVAKPASGPLVFIHSWDIALWVVTELADDGHPCSQSAWNWKHNGTRVTASGPGKGSATPALTGKTANELKQPC